MRKLSLLTLALLASRLAVASTPVLVIDEGADLAHPRLSSFLNPNTTEANGQKGIDDDNDGFADDILGWNQQSNNADYMPPALLTAYQKNATVLAKYFDIYSKVENDDPQAINAWRQLRSNQPKTYQAVVYLLEKSHATHVSGIVAANSVSTAQIQSLNVMSPADEGTQTQRTTGANRLASKLRLFAETGPTAEATPSEFKFSEFLSDANQVNAYIAQEQASENQAADLVSRYVRASKSRVANISLGSSMSQLRKGLEDLWTAENGRLKRPASTPRDATQDKNFNALINGIFAAAESRWTTVFAQNRDILFVVAAGNSTDDNDAIGAAPANASVQYDNVITVAATDKNGLITDFSNFGAKTVNIGAWGKAVPSLAPAGLEVTMSGTSMSSPLVAGVAAKIRDLNPALTAAQVRQLIERTGRKVGSLQGKTTSGAMIDPTAAFAAAQGARSLGLFTGFTAVFSPKDRLFEGAGLAPTSDGTEGLVSRTNDAVREVIGLR